MTETVARIKKIKLIKKIRKIPVARGHNSQFLQAHTCEMTKILKKLFFQSSIFEPFINCSATVSAKQITAGN